MVRRFIASVERDMGKASQISLGRRWLEGGPVLASIGPISDSEFSELSASARRPGETDKGENFSIRHESL